MDIRTIKAFVEVVRQGGFSRAAQALYTTQSNISKSVKQLEEEVGCPLLDRAGRKNMLTQAGELVYRRALNILRECDAIADDIDELKGLKRGTLRLGLPPVGSDILFAPVVAKYRQLYPQVDIVLVEHGSSQLQQMVLDGEIDLAAALLPMPQNAFAWRPVRSEPIDAVISRNHPLSKKKSVKLTELSDIPFALFEASFALNKIVLDACHSFGFNPIVAYRSSQIDFIIELIASQLGVTFLPRMIAQQREQAGVRWVPISEPKLQWDIGMIWRQDSPLPGAAAAWLDLLE